MQNLVHCCNLFLKPASLATTKKRQTAAALQDLAVIAGLHYSLAFWSAAVLPRFETMPLSVTRVQPLQGEARDFARIF
jgi:hypothetical protein